jgi:hypothetical protein
MRSVEQDLAFDDEIGHAALEGSPAVVEMVCDQGLEVSFRSLSLMVCTLAATCDDPPEVVRAFTLQLPHDLDVVLKGGSSGDSPQDRVTVSDQTARH